MSYKGHIVKNPSGVTERKKYRKGSVDRESLGFIKLEKHPLKKTISNIKLATHHIISVRSTETLAKVRKDLLKYKAYNVNHPKNLVTLPTEKKVCCHYAIPRHTSGHTGKNIEVDYGFNEASEINQLTALHKNETDSVSKEEATVDDDMHKFNELLAYHKICRMKLSNKIKLNKLNCKSKPEKVVNSLDELSTELLLEISLFKLNLFNGGKYYKKNESGCRQSDNIKCSRKHGFPLFDIDELYLVKGMLLKNVYHLRSKFEINCEAPKEY